MKKRLLFAIATLCYTGSLFAQCTPDTQYTEDGFYPSTFPEIVVDAAYSESMTVVVPTTTTVDLGPLFGVITANIDSIGVTQVNGLPTGFTYQANTSSGYWPGGGLGCLAMQGTATQGQQGPYPLVIYYRAHGMGTSVLDSVTDITMEIVEAVGLNDLTAAIEFQLMQNQPNPAGEQTRIVFTSPVSGPFQLVVYDLVGHMVFNKTVNARMGENKYLLSTANLQPGIYFYALKNEMYSVARRMEVAH